MAEEGGPLDRAESNRQLGLKPTPRISISFAEWCYTLLAMCSFAASLYALWLASGSAGLSVLIGNTSIASGPAPVAWVPLVSAFLAAAGFIWLSLHMLGKSSALATARQIFAVTQDLAIPDSTKLQLMLAAASTEIKQGRPLDDEAIRTSAAGKWVLERFKEGSSVVAVPEPLITSDKLRNALGGVGDGPIQVLRKEQPFGKSERYDER